MIALSGFCFASWGGVCVDITFVLQRLLNVKSILQIFWKVREPHRESRAKNEISPDQRRLPSRTTFLSSPSMKLRGLYLLGCATNYLFLHPTTPVATLRDAAQSASTSRETRPRRWLPYTPHPVFGPITILKISQN